MINDLCSIGRVISGYKVDNNNWTLLGKGDPKEAQVQLLDYSHLYGIELMN